MAENVSTHDIAVYAGYISDEKELLECTSGGIATALSKEMIRQGGYVAGVAYSEDFYSAQYEIVHERSGLDKFKGSKYIVINKNNIYGDVKALLDKGEKVLFFGLPCIVAAMRAFLKKDYENLITCELVCHGPTQQRVHSDYIKYLEKKYDSKVIDFSVRRKKGVWLPGYLYAKFENGKIFADEFYHTEYGFAFSVSAKPACYNCKFKGNAREGDIMLGDFYSAKPDDDFWNRNGISLVLVHTEKGNDFLKQVEGIKLFQTEFEKAVSEKSMVLRSREKRPEKEKFERLFSEKGLIYAAHRSMSLKRKIVDFCFHVTPQSVKPALKKLYRKVMRINDGIPTE